MATLRRELGLFQATMYGVGLTLGAGIYVLIGKASGEAGNLVWLSFSLAAIIAAFTGLSYAELSSMYPSAAAEAVYVKHAFNSNLLSYVVGSLTIFTAMIAASAVALGFAGYFAVFYNLPLGVSAAVLIILLSILSFVGISESAWTNTIFTIIEASGLIFIIYLGIAFPSNPNVNYLQSVNGFRGVLAALSLVFFAYVGFEGIANIVEETKNPMRTIPRAFILSIVITSGIYTLVALSALRVVDPETLFSSIAPLALIATKVSGPQGEWTLAIIALFATTNTVLMSLIGGSRILYGMAKQGSVPRVFARVHTKTGTPWAAVFFIMTLSTVFVFFGDLETIASITVFTVVVVYALVNLSLLSLRYKQPQVKRPFKSPLNMGRFPLLAVLGLSASMLAILQLNSYAILVGSVVIIISTVSYAATSWNTKSRHAP